MTLGTLLRATECDGGIVSGLRRGGRAECGADGGAWRALSHLSEAPAVYPAFCADAHPTRAPPVAVTVSPSPALT